MNRLIISISLLFALRANAQSTIFDLKNNTTEATRELEYIYNLDVVNSYKLNASEEKYTTELQKEMFKKTEEYQTLLTELKTSKSKIHNITYYIMKNNAFLDEDYDVKRKGFNVPIGSNQNIGCDNSPSKAVYFDGEYIVLKGLPTKKTFSTWRQGVYDESLFLPIAEEAGLKIENDRENSAVYFFFTPSGKEKTTFKTFNIANSGWCTITKELFKSEKVRVVVANNKTGEIFYDQSFTYQQPAVK